MTNGKLNNASGNNAEKYYQQCFVNLGYTDCEISIKNSIEDRLGIDLLNLPYNIQIKSGVQKNMNPGKVLQRMLKKIVNTEYANKPCILIHKKKTFSLFDEEDVIYMINHNIISKNEKYIAVTKYPISDFKVLFHKSKIKNHEAKHI